MLYLEKLFKIIQVSRVHKQSPISCDAGCVYNMAC